MRDYCFTLAIQSTDSADTWAIGASYEGGSREECPPDEPVENKHVQLLALENSPREYGALLSQIVFGSKRLALWRRAWDESRKHGKVLHLRIKLLEDAALNAVKWERLLWPPDDEAEQGSEAQPLVLDKRVNLSRSLSSISPLRNRFEDEPELRAVVAVGDPLDGHEYELPALKSATSLEHIWRGLGDNIRTFVCARGFHGRPEGLTIAAIGDALGEHKPQIFVLVAHSVRTQDGGLYLALETEQGNYNPCPAFDLVRLLAQPVPNLTAAGELTLPLLVILAVCHGADQGQGQTGEQATATAALGWQLAARGVPAVIAFQGEIAIEQTYLFVEKLLEGLGEEGRVASAMVRARHAFEQHDNAFVQREAWWQPALWLQHDDERLWPANRRVQDLRLNLQQEHYSQLDEHVNSFVGRGADVAWVRRTIAEVTSAGRYILISGPMGNGKSCLMARLIADAAGYVEREVELNADRLAVVPHYVLMPTRAPEPREQRIRRLLVELVIRLHLRYRVRPRPGLDQGLLGQEDPVRLKNMLEQILGDVVGPRRYPSTPVVLFIDGLDELFEADGALDLDFLPLLGRLPPRVAIVVSARSDGALVRCYPALLEHHLALGSISPDEFAELVQRKDRELSRYQIDRLYGQLCDSPALLGEAMGYLREADSASRESHRYKLRGFIDRLPPDPSQRYERALRRLSALDIWQGFLAPVMKLLLVARDALSPSMIKSILSLFSEEVDETLEQLDAFIVRDDRGRVRLCLAARRACRSRKSPGNADGLFTREDIAGSNHEMADWCIADERTQPHLLWLHADTELDNERRAYGRAHLPAHLADGNAESFSLLEELLASGYLESQGGSQGIVPVTALEKLRHLIRSVAQPQRAKDFRTRLGSLATLWRCHLYRCQLSDLITALPDEYYAALIKLGRHDELLVLNSYLIPSRRLTVAALAARSEDAALRSRLLLMALDTIIDQESSSPDAHEALLGRELMPFGMLIEELGYRLIECSCWAEALDAIERVDDSATNVELRAALALGLVTAGDVGGGRQQALLAREQYQHSAHEEARARMLSPLVRALVAVGELDVARDCLFELPEPRRTVPYNEAAEAALTLSLAFVATGRGRDTLQLLDEEWFQRHASYGPAVERIAEAIVSYAAIEHRSALERRAETSQGLPMAVGLIKGLSATRQWEEAREIVESFADHDANGLLRLLLIEALVAADELDQAVAVIEAGPSDQALHIPVTLLRALREQGRLDTAERLAAAAMDTLQAAHTQIARQLQMVSDLARAGLWTWAQRLSGELAADEAMIHSLERIAMAQIEVGDHSAVRATFDLLAALAPASSEPSAGRFRETQCKALVKGQARLAAIFARQGVAHEANEAFAAADALLERLKPRDRLAGLAELVVAAAEADDHARVKMFTSLWLTLVADARDMLERIDLLTTGRELVKPLSAMGAWKLLTQLFDALIAKDASGRLAGPERDLLLATAAQHARLPLSGEALAAFSAIMTPDQTSWVAEQLVEAHLRAEVEAGVTDWIERIADPMLRARSYARLAAMAHDPDYLANAYQACQRAIDRQDDSLTERATLAWITAAAAAAHDAMYPELLDQAENLDDEQARLRAHLAVFRACPVAKRGPLLEGLAPEHRRVVEAELAHEVRPQYLDVLLNAVVEEWSQANTVSELFAQVPKAQPLLNESQGLAGVLAGSLQAQRQRLQHNFLM